MTKKRTIQDKAEAIGVSRGHYHKMLREDPDFANLVEQGESDEKLLVYLTNREYDASGITDTDLMRRRKYADMRRAEEEAAIKEIERRVLERELIPEPELRKCIGRAMQVLKNECFGLAPKVRALLVEHIKPAAATAIETEVNEIIRGALQKTTDTLEGME